MKKIIIILSFLLSFITVVKADTADNIPIGYYFKLYDAMKMAHYIELGIPAPNLVVCSPRMERTYAWAMLVYNPLGNRIIKRSITVCVQTLDKFDTQELAWVLLHEGYHYSVLSYSSALQQEYEADAFAAIMAKQLGYSHDICSIFYKIVGEISGDMVGAEDGSHPSLYHRVKQCRDIMSKDIF